MDRYPKTISMGVEELEAQNVEPLSSATTKLCVKDFVWSKEEWPAIKHDDFNSGEDVPVISLANLLGKKKSPEYDELCKEMVDACANWGFFKLVDHGVAHEIIENMKVQCSNLFDLPMEEKLKGERSASMPLGYCATNPDYGKNLPWAEILQLLQSPQRVIAFASKVFGDQHQPFSDAFTKYLYALDELGMVIFEMLAHGLGLSDDFFTKNFEEKDSTMIRVHRYPPCPLPERCLGLGSHSDPHTLTILLQDEVGGLQMLKDNGEWVGIKPISNSFVINVGDTLEAWTNGRLRSVVHRAVVNKEKQRSSIAYFLCPGLDKPVDCPPELVNQTDSPRKYSAFTWGEFRKELLIQKRVYGKTALSRYLISNPTN